jgi:uncharacterized membrane protein YphA (DoxX/SURF4 family)
VEIRIRAPLGELWRLTQTPELHQRWDLRFTDISYLPRPDTSQPQRFLYVTRIGFGLAVRGEGSSVGKSEGSAERSSALKFWSDDRKSLIQDGSGYWKYQEIDGGVRFLTRYGYATRFGIAGSWFDSLVFRPLLGWATAWSFDRLRLWVERGIDPADSLRRSIVHASARTTLAAIWIYQGLVPKLIAPDSGELSILRSSGLFPGSERTVLTLMGMLEIAFGLMLFIGWHRPQMFTLNAILLIALAIGALVSQPSIYLQPFNPATLTAAMIALSMVGGLSYRDLPSARNCRRQAAEDDQ